MILYKIYLFFFLVISSYCTEFKKCDQRDFCGRLRYREPVDYFKFDEESVVITGSKFSGILLPNNGNADDILAFSAQFLEDSTIRFKISEQSSQRYELNEVLDGEPKEVEINQIIKAPGETVIGVNDFNGSAISVKIKYSPLSFEFLRNEEVGLAFIGDDFVMEHNDQSQAFSFRAFFPDAEQLYGIHEHPDSLALQGTRNNQDPYRLRNVDTPYGTHITTAVYGAVPFLYGHGKSTSGFFLHNAAEQWYDTVNSEDGSSAYVYTETGSLDLFVFLGPQPADVVRQYLTITGTSNLPQLWVLGYHQCRYSYMSQDEVKDVITNFDSHNFQMDSIWLDIDYSDSYKYFTWNSETFSDPVDMQNFIESTSRKLVTIIDPHIKVQQGYPVYDGALEKDLFVKNEDGSVFQGNCWPGLSSYMDFLNPAARDYYASWYSYDKFEKTTPTLAGIWNDMNEPSVFDIEEQTIPGNALHYGNVHHKDIHNIYGLLHTKATYQGLLARDNNEKRPFILSRSHFAGSQRYTSIWTGDNGAGWEYLAISYPQCLNANMLGIVICGADVGGFFNNPSEELFQRWYQAGAWLPFFRAHSEKNSNRREPYLFNDDIQKVVRDAIQLRYKHIPVWYTLAYEHVRNKQPIIRPLFYHYPEDTNTFRIDDQLLVGRDILVKAVTDSNRQSVSVYFPGNETWLSINNNDVYTGLQTVDVPVDIKAIPVYYRQGSVIVRKETIRRSTEEMKNDTNTLFVSLGPENTAHGTAYLDDYVSFKFRDNAEFNYVSLDFVGENLTITKIDKDSNSEKFEFVIDEIHFLDVVESPEIGKPGKYKTRIVKTEANGKLLKDMKFGREDKVTIKLAATL